MVEIGERWRRNELSVTCEHYATNYLLQRLGAILRIVPNGYGGPLVWVGCAPSEPTGANSGAIVTGPKTVMAPNIGPAVTPPVNTPSKSVRPAMNCSGVNDVVS